MKQEKLDKMARSMERIAKKTIKESENWEEKDMKQMFRDDAEDYLQIAELIRQGDLKNAARRANFLDTASRDEIACYVYDTLMEYY